VGVEKPKASEVTEQPMLRLLLSVIVTTLTFAANGAIAQTLSGTAFAVAPELLVTNEHVVTGCSSIEVISADGRRKASVVVVDADIDLAVVRVSGLKGATARLRSPRVVRLGESVMVFGYPLAGALTSGGNFTAGLVSGLRGLRDTAGELQITAPVQSGNSGGPLLDASGLVIGVVQAKLDALRAAIATGDIPQNVNFAVSLEVLADFLAKNNVAFRSGAISKPLDSAKVAELAQSFTHRVECRGKSQQAKASPEVSRPPLPVSPDVRQGPVPSCPGSYNRATWTNCVGEVRMTNGATYVGEFRDGKRHGQGTNSLPDGRKYVGAWMDDKPNGQGTLTLPGGGKYVGGFRDDRPDGRGTFTWPNGQEYVGEFRNGLRHGQGTHVYFDGMKYIGEWTSEMRHGQGILYHADGTILQAGRWENGIFRGQ